MAVREADGDSRSYFREGYESHPETKMLQRPYSVMAEWVLKDIVNEATKWQGDRVPEGFDPWNSWGGEYTARQIAFSNAKSAQAELDSRTAKAKAKPDPTPQP
jgi:hypothetical protein